jgi:RecA/RadA recombinase
MSLVKKFLRDNPGSIVFYYDTEGAIEDDFIRSRGINPDRVAVASASTIEEIKNKIINLLDGIEKVPVSKRPRFMVIIDSLGNLATAKEVNDARDGNNVRDMTRAQQFRSLARSIGGRMGRMGIPLFVTNHTYENTGNPYAGKQMSGGGRS